MLFRRFESLIDPFKPAPDVAPPRSLLRFYWHFIRQIWPVFLALMVVGLAAALIEVALFSYLGRIVDLAQAGGGTQFFREHGLELAWMACVALLLRPLVFGLHDLLVHQSIAPNLTNLVRWQNHRYVLRQSLSFFHNDFAGRIANRVMMTAPSLRESAVQVLDALWHVLIYAVSAIWLFAAADVRLTLPLLVWICAYVALLCHFVPRVKQRSLDASSARSKVMGRMVDGYTNIATLKLFAHTRDEEDYARSAMAELLERVRAITRTISAMDMSVTALNGVLITATCALALWLWSSGEISVGAIALATALVIRINGLAEWIMWVVNGIFDNIGTVQDGMRSIVQPRLGMDRPDAVPLQIKRGEVRVEQLQFHYGKGSGVIEGLDLTVAAGERIGLVGPSGAGKSTLVNLLLRLHEPEGGRILVDGQDIACVTQDSLRAQIGTVTQDTSLLHRSIRENLLYGKPDASEEELWAAVRQARADQFIPQLVDSEGRCGMDAYVGDRGVKLSGGQRQRIAIARVLLKNAPILILDEATAALDSEVEAAIQDSLEPLMQGKTVIAIAHRLSTIARMDRLVVLDQGRIVETGSHAQLLAQGGLYARLWRKQTGGFVGV